MRFKKKTDYCIRVLIFLQSAKKKVKIQDIAEAYNISKNHLSVAVNQLSDLGYVITTQGPKGGIEFNPKAGEKTVGELISEIEEFEIVECFDPKSNTCSLDPHCKLKGMIKKATKSFIGELKKFKVKDLA